jgi:hypothetical protein
MTTARDLAKTEKWKDVKKTFRRYYPRESRNIEYYGKVLEKLDRFRRKKPTGKKEYLEITAVGRSILTDVPYYKACGSKYSLSFRKWSDIANMPISEGTLRHVTPADILAHLIWEITFFGSEVKASKEAKKLRIIAKRIRRSGKS